MLQLFVKADYESQIDEKKAEFARALVANLAEITGIDVLNFYLNYDEHANWVSGNIYK